MTVINNIEIDNIEYQSNDIKEAILNNDMIEPKLHVVIVISNPCLYARRYILAREFIRRMETEEHNSIELYVVELCYGEKQKFCVTNHTNKKHLQIRTYAQPLWHKENMINIAIKKLLPHNWKAVAWIDADIEFESTTWAQDTLKILNGSKDIVQLFSHCIDMNENNLAMNIFGSFGYQYCKKNPYSGKGFNYWHPGFAWACTRRAYERMGGLFDKGVLGSGDNMMAMSLIKKADACFKNTNYSKGYENSLYEFQKKCQSLRLGYVPGVIRHYFHGAKSDRKYSERWKILEKHSFDPNIHVTYDKSMHGLLVNTVECPQELLDDIFNYFNERNEDSIYLCKK